VVWSSTVVRVPVQGRTIPYSIAYVDLDEGPRVLAHVASGAVEALLIGARVELDGMNERGDVLVRPT
jgi:uncharacterized OB-fold protein